MINLAFLTTHVLHPTSDAHSVNRGRLIATVMPKLTDWNR